MICQKCGARLPDEAVFCTTCGNRIEKSASAGGEDAAAPYSPGRTTETVETYQRVVAENTPQAVSGAKATKRRWPLVLAIVIVVIIVGAFVRGGSVHTIQDDITKEELQQLANNYASNFNFIPCQVTAGASGNTITLRATLTISVDQLLGGDYMRYFSGLGLDQIVAQYWFSDEALAQLSRMCAELEKQGYAGTSIVIQVQDRDGGSLASKTVTSSG